MNRHSEAARGAGRAPDRRGKRAEDQWFRSPFRGAAPAATAPPPRPLPDRDLRASGPMRLVAGVLPLALFAPFARAEDTATLPAPAPGSLAAPVPASPPPAAPAANHVGWTRVPFRVVRVMPETRQALLFDRIRNTHVLAEVGGTLDGYTIEDIDDETVSLRRDNQQVVLAAPPHGSPRARELPPVRLRSATAVP